MDALDLKMEEMKIQSWQTGSISITTQRKRVSTIYLKYYNIAKTMSSIRTIKPYTGVFDVCI